jgi:6-methylsalicylate decarboxylase
MMTRRTLAGLAAAVPLSASLASPAASKAAGGQIIDVHSHALLPRWLDKAAAAQGVSRANMRIAQSPVPDWTPDLHVATMDAHGIQASVLSWPSATALARGKEARDLARAMNEDLAEIIARHPGRFGAFAVLPLDDMDATNEEMAYALDVLKFDGVSASTHVNGVYLGDAAFDPWFAEMQRRGVTLFTHPTTPPGQTRTPLDINPAIIEFMFETTRMVTNLVVSGAKTRFDKIKIIASHGGGAIPYLATRISILEPHFGAGPGRTTVSGEDVLKTLASFYFDLTASTAAASIDAIRHLVPTSQLMMGFDFPMMPPSTIAPAQARFAAYRNLTDDERRGIVRETALALLPSLAGRLGGKAA